MNRFWLSFQLTSPLEQFEYHGPWWVSGYGFDAEGNEQPCVCMAVVAADEDAARKVALDSFDEPPTIVEWRFCSDRAADWDPFCDRFERAQWMRWPWGAPGKPARNVNENSFAR